MKCIGDDIPSTIPIGGLCKTDNQCVIPRGVNHGVSHNGVCNDYNTNPYAIPIGDECNWSDVSPNQCCFPPGLSHGVCIRGKCQNGESGSYCHEDHDCISGSCGSDAHCLPNVFTTKAIAAILFYFLVLHENYYWLTSFSQSSCNSNSNRTCSKII